MKKSKAIFIGGVAAAGALVLITGLLTISGLSSASESSRKLEISRGKLDSFYRRSPFPDEKNISVEKENLRKAEEWNSKLMDSVRKGEYVPYEKAPTPGRFSILREQTIAELQGEAPRGNRTEPIVSPDFTFGFDRYRGGSLARGPDVPRLIKQLALIKILVNTLYECDVIKLEAVRREGFEKGSSNTAALYGAGSDSGRGRSRRRRGSSVGASKSDTFKDEPMEQGPIPVDRQRFELVFTARQNSMLKVLNSIMQMEPFAMVSSLSFAKIGNDVAVIQPEAAGGDANKKDAAGDAARQTIVNVRPPSRTARLVSGRLKEAPVRVTLGVDILSFNPGCAAGGGEYAADSGL